MVSPGLQPNPETERKSTADTRTVFSLLTTPNSSVNAGDHVPRCDKPRLFKSTLNIPWLRPAVTLSYSPKAVVLPC